MTKEEVQETIARYKTRVRLLWKKNRREAAERQRVIDQEHLKAIDGYLEESKGHVVTLQKKKAHIAYAFPCLHQPSRSSIRNILKRKQNYSYKNLKSEIKNSLSLPKFNYFIQNAILQLKLDQLNVELIYLDEFSYSPRK